MNDPASPGVSQPAELSFLSGGGEMGERIRSFDWTATSLGPPAQWPQSLKTSVRIMLASRQPIWIGWGKELIYLYNDPYKAIIGGRHPGALGRPTTQVWPEIWDIIGPMLETAMSGVEGTYVEEQLLIMERHGYREETYYTYSYTPIPDEFGHAGGIICANTDDTQRVIGQRQLDLLRELSSATASATSAEQVCELAVRIFGAHNLDISFALLYLVDPAQKEAKLFSNTSLPSTVAPARLLVDDGESLGEHTWPFQKALAGETVTLRNMSQCTPLPGGAWPELTDNVLVLPLVKPGERPVGILVAGASPRRTLDDKYRAFFDLLASNLTSAISTARAYQEERQRAEALAELDRAKTAFFSNVSHEFRTPLTLMLGPIEELRRTTPPGAQSEQLELLHRNSIRLLKMVNTLLEFSRIEAGRIQANYEPTPLAEFTTELASVFRSAVEKAGLRLIVDCPPLPEPVFVDREMWEKIVLNLLSNALKFTFDGEIRVSLRWCGERVELAVSDTGAGISAADLPRIFERFFRVRGIRSRTHEGTGIGLALVQELARLHGGEARVQSEEGSGSTFLVSIQTGETHLPRERIKAKSKESTALGAMPFIDEALRWLPNERARQSKNIPSLPSCCDRPQAHAPGSPFILLADDNADMRDYVCRLLAADYEVEAVEDGQAAIERIRARRPDLVLTDVMMPRVDGFGLVQRLRSNEHTRSIPVIMLSARAGEESRLEGWDAGADDYLIKPFSARELRARIGSHLRLSQLRRQAEEATRHRASQLETIINAAPIGVFLVDANFKIVQANPIALPAFGKPKDEIERRDFAEVIRGLIPETAADEMVERFRSTLESGVPYERHEFEFARKQADTPAEYYDWRIERVILPDNRFGIVCYFSNISAQVAASGKLAEANELLADRARQLETLVGQRTAELRETVQQLETFSYSIVHDMRAPLRSMRSFASILDEEYKDKLDDSGRSYLARIISASSRLDVLITDVLTYSRVAMNQAEPHRIDLDSLVREIIEQYPQFQDAAQYVRVENQLPAVLGNGALLTQVVSNLVGNALKFVPPGQVPNVKIRAERMPGRVRLWVEDNGIGIAAEHRDKLFNLFQRLHRPNEYAGTGVGLAIVKKAVERMGGSVGLESEPGVGSRFWCDLPPADAGAQD